jgi:deazaflavin-dependent oxidoreductase (nitroreductase family)
MTQPKFDEEQLREVFKKFNKFMLVLWRLGFGRFFGMWPDGWGQIMVITHTGRKSGRKLQTPVNFAIIEDDIYCVAAFGKKTHWFRNVSVNPAVEVWLPEGWWQGTAADASAIENRLLIIRQVLINSGLATTTFEGFDPKTISADELVERTKDYRLIRITKDAARTGPGGPGELAWIWPIATFLLLPLALRRKK